MNAKKNRQSEVFVGSIDVPALPHTNLEIIHKLASDINMNGYTVRKISIFEDPLIANIEIETNSSAQTNTSIPPFSKKPKLKDMSQTLYLDLRLKNCTDLSNRQRLTYCIKVDKFRMKNSAASSVLMDARRVRDQLVYNFNGLTSSTLFLSPIQSA